MVNIYWTLLPLVLVIAIIIEMLKDQPNIQGVLKRSFLSVILLLSFPFIFDSISMLGDALSERVRGGTDIWHFLDIRRTETIDVSFSWINIKHSILFFLNIIAYFIAYLGFFFTSAIIHFIWALLFILSPMMVLMMVFSETLYVTKSLFGSLIKVMSWKVLYTLLAVLLIKFTQNYGTTHSDDNFITTIVINLCVGLSMLFIPLFANSFIGNGLSSLASGAAMTSSYIVYKSANKAGVGLKKSFLRQAPRINQTNPKEDNEKRKI